MPAIMNAPPGQPPHGLELDESLRWGWLTPLIFGALLLGVAAGFGFSTPALALGAPVGSKSSGRLRLGIIHPFPRLCRGGEHAQRDLRVLRLAFGLGRTAESRRLPWFYRPEQREGGSGEEISILLDTAALWGLPPTVLGAGSPEGGGNSPSGAPVSWRAIVMKRLAPAGSMVEGRPDRITVARAGAGLFIWSSLGGGNLLPFHFNGGSDRSDLPPSCQSWPKGVALERERERGRIRYRLTGEGGAVHPPFRLTAFHAGSQLMKEARRGRLELLLLEGDELKAIVKERSDPSWKIGVERGTQQTVLRLKSALRGELGAEGLMALSLALSRERLAAVAGEGFAAVSNFMEPLLPGQISPPEEPLRWNTRRARRIWMSKKRPERRIGLALLSHPVLEEVGRALAGQVKKTLNLSLFVHSYPPGSFAEASEKGQIEMIIETVDLDDGSLQELWSDAILNEATPGGSPAQGADPAPLEKMLRAELPYLPLIANRAYYLIINKKGAKALPIICPECQIMTLAKYKKKSRIR